MAEDLPAQLAWFRQGSVLAGYRLEAQVGAGGMAVVFRARDERLDRLVALKILALALASDEAFRRRFIAESRAAARVDDPHIIPVYEAGEADGVLFIAMRFVIGGDLRRVLNQEGALSPDRAAEFISPVASALDAAHRAGLVHRDVKPANILVDARPDRPDHVYLSDFGVSKGAVSSVSVTGQFIGTPDYSAPEQIQGRVVDGRTDQYALACVAYQLLTGSVPFERDQGMAVLLAHLSEPPPSLRSRRPDLPAAADQVLARALAKDPGKRYRSCGDFANALREALDLTSYLRHFATTPDRPQTVITSPPEFPRLAAADAGMAAVPADLASPATLDFVPGGRLETMPPMTPAVADEDIPAAAATATRARVADVHTSDHRPPSIPRSHRQVQPTRRRRRLLATILAGAVVAAAAIVVPLLASTPSSQSFTFTSTFTDPGGGGVTAVAFSPNGATLATADSESETYLWNTATGNQTATLTDPGGFITAAAFSPNGATLLTANLNGHTYLWNVAIRKLTATFTDPAAAGATGVRRAAFSPNGATVAAADGNGHTYLWNAATGRLAATLTDPGRLSVIAVAFRPNGAILATGDGSGNTYLWDVATRKLTATLTDPDSESVTAVAFSPSGATLATADANGHTYLWNVATRKLTATLTDPDSESVTAVTFSPSGATLATADANGHTYLWNAATGTLTATLTEPAGDGASDGITSVAFSPSGATLATGDNNGSIYLWNSS